MSVSDDIYKMLEESEEILATLAEAFGPDDYRHTHALQIFRDLVVDPTDETVKLALMYLRWCQNYPTRIGKESEPLDGTTCGDCDKTICHNGFILDSAEDDTWRPCHRLMPQLHEHWQKETGYLYEKR